MCTMIDKIFALIFGYDAMVAKVHMCKLNPLIQFMLLLFFLIPSRSYGKGCR
jgi:hypothetical protein